MLSQGFGRRRGAVLSHATVSTVGRRTGEERAIGGGGIEEFVRMETDEEGVQMERGEMGGGCGQSDKERQDYECHPFCPSLSEQQQHEHSDGSLYFSLWKESRS